VIISGPQLLAPLKVGPIIVGFFVVVGGFAWSMGGKKLLSQILTISGQSSSSYDLKFGR
jgi:hypothetical protein